jgi:putative component of membrane protein insertase Oxa1/YidC/SpoIIIJ protein YidD
MIRTWSKDGPNKVQTCSKHGPNMLQIGFKYAPNTVQAYYAPIISKYAPNTLQIWTKHGPNMLQARSKYDPHMTNICSKYIFQTCSKYAPCMVLLFSLLRVTDKHMFAPRSLPPVPAFLTPRLRRRCRIYYI